MSVRISSLKSTAEREEGWSKCSCALFPAVEGHFVSVVRYRKDCRCDVKKHTFLWEVMDFLSLLTQQFRASIREIDYDIRHI